MSPFMRLWSLTLVVKLIAGALLPLFSDEAYYWFWSEELQLSYYDHPPFVAWLFWLGQPLDAFGQAVRWPGIIMGHASLLIWYRLLKPHLPPERLNFFLLFYLLNPLVGWGSLAVLPDTPLLFFWPLSILCLLRLLESQNWRWGAALGAALGLGFCSKYHIVLFVPITVVWLTWSRGWRNVPLASVAACIVTGLLFCTPVLLWNYWNDWDSFFYQIKHGLGVKEYNPRWAVEFILTHVGLLFPTTIYVLLRAKFQPKLAWLYYFGWGPLIFFFISAFKGRPEANWPSISYPTLLALALTASQSLTWAKRTLAVWSALFILVCTEIIHPWIPVEPGRLKTFELVEYDPLVKVAESYTPFYASSFQMASMLTYRLKTPVYKLRGIGRRDFYDYLEGSMPKGDSFFVALRRWDQLPKWTEGYKEVNRIVVNPTFTLIELRKN